MWLKFWQSRFCLFSRQGRVRPEACVQLPSEFRRKLCHSCDTLLRRFEGALLISNLIKAMKDNCAVATSVLSERRRIYGSTEFKGVTGNQTSTKVAKRFTQELPNPATPRVTLAPQASRPSTKSSIAE